MKFHLTNRKSRVLFSDNTAGWGRIRWRPHPASHPSPSTPTRSPEGSVYKPRCRIFLCTSSQKPLSWVLISKCPLLPKHIQVMVSAGPLMLSWSPVLTRPLVNRVYFILSELMMVCDYRTNKCTQFSETFEKCFSIGTSYTVLCTVFQAATSVKCFYELRVCLCLRVPFASLKHFLR